MLDRAAIQAAKKAAIERGEEAPQKQRNQPVKAGSERCMPRVRCALNNLYNLERHTRTGRCDYYQDFGHEANAVRVGVWCQGCEAGMHRECYFSYHQLRYGVYLDSRYKVNKSRVKQGTKALILRKEANFPWNALQPDIHS